MAINLNSLRRAGVKECARIIIYGPQGVGKTTLAACAPSPVFIQTEDGISDPRLADIPTFGLLTTYDEVYEAACSLGAEEHEFKTLAIDTLDWLEPIIWAETCRRHKWETIETPDYGKGYAAALAVWKELYGVFDALYNVKKMSIIFLAHSTITNFKSPETEPYDRYEIKLHVSKAGIGARSFVQEHADDVFFINQHTSIAKDGKAPTGNSKNDARHVRGVGNGQRVIYTERRPAFEAKNRYGMPSSIRLPDDPAMAWPTLAAYLPFASGPKNETDQTETTE